MPKKIDILYFGEAEPKELSLMVAENMQQSLGAVVNAMPTQSNEELTTKVANGDFTLAILPITATSNTPQHFFETFTKNSGNNIYGFENKKYDEEVSKIKPDSNEATVTSAAEKALKTLISDISIIPLAMHLEGFGYSKEFTCPTVSPFGGVIDLALVRKSK